MNPWGGTLSQSSKSSGARRFLPDDVEEEEEDAAGGECIWGGIAGRCFESGVRGLKTGGGGILWSGVLSFEKMDGPDRVRARELLGVEGVRENVVEAGGGTADVDACREGGSDCVGAVFKWAGTAAGAGRD